MEITFAPGLMERDTFGEEEETEETTLEAYKRKMKEKKRIRKEIREEKFGKTKDPKEEKKKGSVSKGEDDFFGKVDEDDSDDETPTILPPSSSKSTKSSSKSKSDPSSTADANKEAALLDLLTLPTPNALAIDDSKHFSMTDIIKDEKNSLGGKKKRKRGPHGGKLKEAKERDVELGDQGFEIDVKDERFSKKLNEDHRFAIDPSNPQYVDRVSSLLLFSRRVSFSPPPPPLRVWLRVFRLVTDSFSFPLLSFPRFTASRRPSRCRNSSRNDLVCARSKVGRELERRRTRRRSLPRTLVEEEQQRWIFRILSRV